MIPPGGTAVVGVKYTTMLFGDRQDVPVKRATSGWLVVLTAAQADGVVAQFPEIRDETVKGEVWLASVKACTFFTVTPTLKAPSAVLGVHMKAFK